MSTNNPTKKTSPKIGDINEFTELYQSISNILWKCEPSLIDAKTLIENTTGIKTQTKKSLMTKIDNIFSEMNAIMDIAKKFVMDEYMIRPGNDDDIVEWEKHDNYNKEAYAFAEAVIEKFKECYVL